MTANKSGSQDRRKGIFLSITKRSGRTALAKMFVHGGSAAAVLAGTLIPTTNVGHSFWKEGGEARAAQKIQIMKNLAMLGGLLLVMADNN